MSQNNSLTHLLTDQRDQNDKEKTKGAQEQENKLETVLKMVENIQEGQNKKKSFWQRRKAN